jgi:lambda repressor-like predicted transcriptional regulator
MVVLYQQGLSMRAVSRRLGVSYAALRAVLVEAGVLRHQGVRGVDVDALVAQYEAGVSLGRVAAQSGCGSAHTAARYLRRAGVTLRGRTARTNASQRVASRDAAAIVALYGQGLSMREVADRLRVPFSSVWSAVDQAGVARQVGPHLGDVDVDALVELYEAGHSLDALARRTGWGPARVARRLREAGVTLRAAGRRRATA